MKNTKKIALTTSVVVAASALAGCGLLQSEKEKFLTAIENTAVQEGTAVVKLSAKAVVKDEGAEEIVKILDNSYLQLTTSYDSKTKDEELLAKLVLPLTVEGAVEELNVELNFNMFIDGEKQELYFDLGQLKGDIDKVLAQKDKIAPEVLGLTSVAERDGALTYGAAEIITAVEEGLGFKFEDEKDELVKISLKEIGASDAEFQKLLDDVYKNSAEDKKITASLLKKAFGSINEEKFKDSQLKLDIVNVFDMAIAMLESEEAKKLAKDDPSLQAILDEMLTLKGERESVVEASKQQKIDFVFDYSIKKKQFEELDFTANIKAAEEGESIAIKLEADFDKKAKFTLENKVKGATIVDVTPELIELGVASEIGAIAGSSEAAGAGAVGAGALLYPYIDRMINPIGGDSDMGEGITGGLEFAPTDAE